MQAFFSLKGSDRWVIYNKKHYQDYDGSMIPAEWYGWMHHKVDEPPTVVSCFQKSNNVNF